MVGDMPSAPPNLQALLSDQGRTALVQQGPDIPALRLKALRDSAIAYGVRSGLARRSYEIAQVVDKQSTTLDGIFNFGSLMLDHSVVPPVLTTSVQSMKITGGDAIRVSDTTYTIEIQAHFATAAPNWRDYLRPSAVYAVDPPDAALMPKNPAETAAWKQYVAQGWVQGEDQADAIFDQSLSRLKRDFTGMILYRRLLAQGMVSKPYVARADLGVTGNGHSISINDRVLRITATPQLNTHADSWRPLPIPSDVQPAASSSSSTGSDL